MDNSENYILAIDISSKKIKIGLVSENLQLDSFISLELKIIDEDIDGFAKSFAMDDVWNKLKRGIYDLLQKKNKSNNFNILGISSCAQRMAVVFLDKQGEAIYFYLEL